MTATLQQLYDHIKELVHQKFETKEEEDITLPQIVESYFNYNQGELDIDIPHMKLEITGSSFSSYNSSPFTYNGRVFVDWGDDSGLLEYAGGTLSHTFTDGLTSHTVKVYGDITSLEEYCFMSCSGLTSISIPDSVQSLGEYCFIGCSGLTSISIPDSVQSLGDFCFYSCSGLTSIQLNWTGNNILTYQSNWIQHTSSSLKFNIPSGTTEYYVQAGYPSDKLLESD